MEPGLEAINYYDPPNFTFPFGAYLRDGYRRRYRRVEGTALHAPDDCGTRINLMIIEGQIHGG